MPSASSLPKYHPATIIRADPSTGWQFSIADALTGVACFGATGSGKTSGSGTHLALGYLGSAAEMGFLVLCAKKDEAEQWRKWAQATGRSDDLIMFDASGERWRFNFLDWELSRASDGGGLTINVVALLEEIILALQPERSGGSGENLFWEDALHNLLVHAVELVQLAGPEYPLRLEHMRDIVRSAPVSREQAQDPKWQEESPCWFFLQEAARTTAGGDEELKADYQECRAYWLDDFGNLSDRTKSIITLMFTKLVQPFTARPLRKLFSTDTTVKPEDTFAGKIIVINIPTQEYFLVGKIAAITWKYCTQMAIMHRPLPTKPDEHLRPVCIFADEAAENFLSRGDSAFQAVARSSGGCTVYLAQNINQYRKRLGDNDAFESFISNLQTKFFHQVTGPTATWASELLGQRYETIASVTGGGVTPEAQNGYGSTHGSATLSEQRRYFVEPSRFTTLKRGGVAYNYEVECICYRGGHIFGCTCRGSHDPQKCKGKPYIQLTFNQRK